MRLLLRKNDQYCKVFKLNKGSNNKAIVGNLMLFEMLQTFIPGATETDFHFSYFDNGNYHFSYKYFDIDDKHYYDRKLYHNHVSTYKSMEVKTLKTNQILRRDIDLNNPLDMFMMGEPLLPWSDRPIGHTFSVVGMSFSEEGLTKVTWLNKTNIDENNDLIINVNDYLDHQVSFGCAFYNIGNPTFDFTINPPKVPYMEKILNIYDDLVIKVYAVIIPQ